MSINRQMGKEDVVHTHRKEYYSAIKNNERLPSWLRGKESTCNARAMGSIPGLKWQPTSVFLPGKSHGQEEPAGYSTH